MTTASGDGSCDRASTKSPPKVSSSLNVEVSSPPTISQGGMGNVVRWPKARHAPQRPRMCRMPGSPAHMRPGGHLRTPCCASYVPTIRNDRADRRRSCSARSSTPCRRHLSLQPDGSGKNIRGGPWSAAGRVPECGAHQHFGLMLGRRSSESAFHWLLIYFSLKRLQIGLWFFAQRPRGGLPRSLRDGCGLQSGPPVRSQTTCGGCRRQPVMKLAGRQSDHR